MLMLRLVLLVLSEKRDLTIHIAAHTESQEQSATV